MSACKEVFSPFFPLWRREEEEDEEGGGMGDRRSISGSESEEGRAHVRNRKGGRGSFVTELGGGGNLSSSLSFILVGAGFDRAENCL